MHRLTSIVFLIAATSAVALAGIQVAPEISAGSAAGALTLLSGAMLVLRARRRRK